MLLIPNTFGQAELKYQFVTKPDWLVYAESLFVFILRGIKKRSVKEKKINGEGVWQERTLETG